METILKLLSENPESLGIIAKTYIEKYKKPVYDVLEGIVAIAKDYSENTEYPAIVAKTSIMTDTTNQTRKNMFDAYVNVGFTEDQALALMINDNIRLMENIKKSAGNASFKKNK